MKLDQALDEYGLSQRRRFRGEEGRRAAAALSALREYLVDYSGYEETAELRPADLYRFLLEYYPSEEEPDPEVAGALLEAAAGLALWLTERGERSLAGFLGAEERLRTDLPRALEAYAALRAHVRRDDLETTVALGGSGEGDEGDEDAEEVIGTAGAGLSRVARLDEIDYPAAEHDYFTVRSVAADSLVLSSPQREALGEPPAAPVHTPSAAAERLRPGDIIHGEIAPGPAGWEWLEVLAVRPGGYA